MAFVVGLALTACTSVGTGSDAVRGAVGGAGTRGEASAILGSNDAGSADTSEARARAGTNRDAGSPSRGAPDAGHAAGSSDPKEGNERETEDSGVAGSSAGGGAGGATGGTLGYDEEGSAGGSGGAGGTNQESGTAGSASASPPPACSFDLDHGGPGTRCVGLLFESCTVVDGVAVYQSTR
ncbi:MAG TPA: hypothetical protein VG963_29785, partial [Polyangiaceae bacterium]|nr:hypothetical protein [Polyangiaceae bacterium]